MSKETDSIMAIVRERGPDIRRSDLDRIERLFMAMEPEEVAEQRPWIMESVWLTISVPEYDGDISPGDLD